MEHKILSRYPLGNPRRVWRQDKFILSTFSLRAGDPRQAVRLLKEAGFNLVELGWAPHEEAEAALRAAEELDIDLLYQDFSAFGGMQENHMERGVPAAVMKQLGDHLRPWRRCIGTYVWDEPYGEDQLREARRQADLIRHELPERLHFTVAIPSYNLKYTWQNGQFPDYLEQYVRIIDPPVLSLDYYPIGMPGVYTDEKQLDDSLLWCDLGLMRKLGRQYDLPIWFYYQAVDLHKYGTFHAAMVRCMMYAACLYGAKGLQQYTSAGSVLGENGGKGPLFEAQKQLHREFAALGGTLMALESEFVFHSTDLLPGCPYMEGLADDITGSELFAAPLPSRTSVAELHDAYGDRYVMVLNRDYEKPARLSLPLKDFYRLYAVDRETGEQHMTENAADVLRCFLAPGDAVLLRVQRSAEEPFTLEYRLEK